MQNLETETGVQRIWRDASNNITGIWLSPAVANDDNVKLLAGLSELRSVKISCAPSGQQLSADGVRSLGKLSKLVELDLHRAVDVISPETTTAIGELGGLESLSIRYSAVPEDAIPPLKRLRHLHCLRIANTASVGDRHVKAIVTISSLRELDLSFTEVSDSCLGDVEKLPDLETFVDIGTRISENGLRTSGLPAMLHVVERAGSTPTSRPWQPELCDRRIRGGQSTKSRINH